MKYNNNITIIEEHMEFKLSDLKEDEYFAIMTADYNKQRPAIGFLDKSRGKIGLEVDKENKVKISKLFSGVVFCKGYICKVRVKAVSLCNKIDLLT